MCCVHWWYGIRLSVFVVVFVVVVVVVVVAVVVAVVFIVAYCEFIKHFESMQFSVALLEESRNQNWTYDAKQYGEYFTGREVVAISLASAWIFFVQFKDWWAEVSAVIIAAWNALLNKQVWLFYVHGEWDLHCYANSVHQCMQSSCLTKQHTSV